ncbi:D-alanyl-D-alanine carboxypeptidase [Virgibacillus natechei]|uniref:D-alanyl-D-alanine carboxypeptidase n=1 Tax=Virgibacillus natechei TaxID=1216297 RepID=A0ABS4IFC1_9BACI|nr:D-alanyl-D-alanine carboxypeptidase family protein [Virgibacillus natechei]MBP1969649.1 D-alanyl-D-alanine carboxypeptidase [Virgibacillus natechei]UZD11377.1 D-alanyl-D-alanine carboxypeptidase [Virgibacillus natechei]
MRFVLCVICLLLLNLIYPSTGQAEPGVSASNAILIEQSTGRVLFEKQAHEEELIASITKIMTGLLAIESGMMKEKATTSRKAVYTEGSSIYLEQGEKITIEDLVYGLMLRSGNDAAIALSEHIGGSEEGFVYLMNEKANWLGMTNSNFENPHGLDSDNHYSTAYDMALLMSRAMDNEQFREVSETTSYQSSNRSYSWQNKNKLLTQYYDNSTGGKTGFTRSSGRTLVSSANKNGMDLIAVTLNAPNDWEDHIAMFEWGFENFDMKSIAGEGKQEYLLEKSDTIGYLHRDLVFPLTEDEMANIDNQSYLLKENNRTDNVIGRTEFYLGENKIMETSIFNDHSGLEEEGFFQNVFSLYKKVIGLY